jgi:hypothetical protein
MKICRKKVKYEFMQIGHKSVDIIVRVLKVCKTVNALKTCSTDHIRSL